MTTSRIYAYRWPARLVSHKPFAAERYFITSACIWQVFFQKNRIFLFYFLRTVFWRIFCAFCILRSTFLRGKLPCLSGCTGMGRFIQKDPLRQGPQALTERVILYFFCFSCSSSPSRGVTYTVVYTSYRTMPGFAPLAFQIFFTSVVSTATLAPVPAL